MGNRMGFGYELPDGSYRATYVHWAPAEEKLTHELVELIWSGDYDTYIRWVEEGIAGTGHSTLDSGAYNDGEELLITPATVSKADVGGVYVLAYDEATGDYAWLKRDMNY